MCKLGQPSLSLNQHYAQMRLEETYPLVEVSRETDRQSNRVKEKGVSKRPLKPIDCRFRQMSISKCVEGSKEDGKHAILIQKKSRGGSF